MVNHSGNKKIVLKSASDRSCQWEKLELSFMVQHKREKNWSEISCYEPLLLTQSTLKKESISGHFRFGLRVQIMKGRMTGTN